MRTEQVALTNKPLVDSLMNGYKIDSTHITYSVERIIPPEVLEELYKIEKFKELSGVSMDITQSMKYMLAIKSAFKTISSYISFNFVESMDNTPELTISGISDIEYIENGSHVNRAAVASVAKPVNIVTYVVFDLTNPDKNGQTTNYEYDEVADAGGAREHIAIHELMHTLGLLDITSSIKGKPADSNLFTIMSYNRLSAETPYGQAITPMALDVAALQHMYGAVNNAIGNTNYRLIEDGVRKDLDSTDGTIAIGRALYTIWDTGGTDTISYDGSSKRAIINLNEATLNENANDVSDDLYYIFSNFYDTNQLPDFLQKNLLNSAYNAGGFLSTTFEGNSHTKGGFMIANSSMGGSFNTGIENATGGQNDDVIVGNHLNNVLLGNDGNDFIYGAGGNDYIDGGNGNDVLIGGEDYSIIFGGNGNDTIIVNAAGSFDGEAGNDIIDISRLDTNTDEGYVNGGTGHDIVYLNSLSGVSVQFRVDKPVLIVNGLEIENVEEFRVGWEYSNETRQWDFGLTGQTYSLLEIYEKALNGDIPTNSFGLRGNTQWQQIETSVIDETKSDDNSQIVVFKARLKTPLQEGVSAFIATISVLGQNYQANYTENNGVWTFTLPKSVVKNFERDTLFTGTVWLDYSQAGDPDFSTTDLSFGGVIMNISTPEIVTPDSLNADKNDNVSIALEIDGLDATDDIIWTVTSSNASLFTISSNSVLSNVNSLAFTSEDPVSVSIQAEVGSNIYSKTITISPRLVIDDVIGTSDGEIILDTWRNDTIYADEGNDIIYSSNGYDTIYGEDGDDTIISSVTGYFDGGTGNDIFDISSVQTLGGQSGVIEGGSGIDVIYIDDLTNTSVTLNGDVFNLMINGFKVSGVEEYRIGWDVDANGVRSENSTSKTLSYWNLITKAMEGEIDGLNPNWHNISVAAIDETLELTGEQIVVFQGVLKSTLPNGIEISDAMVSINGVNYAAGITVLNGLYTVTVPKIFIADVIKNTVYEGELFSRDANGVLTKQVNFTGLIRDVYDLQNAPTEIIGNSVIDPTGTDTFDSVQFSVDHFNQDKPITWTISGTGSELFSISNDGVLSSNGVIDLSVPYDLTVQATDGVKTVTKNIYINPYNPINTIFGTSGDDILNGTAQEDIIYGLDGDDTIYVGGGFDTVYGGAGNDTIIASDNYVDLYGEDGNDTLIGSVQDDYLYGGDGDDIIYGGGHKDRIWGGSGADVFVYKSVTDSDYENLDLSDRIFDLEDIDSFDFTEIGGVSFDWDNGPAGSLYVEVNWQPDRNYGYLSIDVDRDGVFDMAIDFDVGASGLSQINFVNGPTYYLDSGFTASSIDSDELLVKPITDNAPDAHNEYQWAA